MPAPEGFLQEIPNIFQDAQRSLATHRKNAAALRKIIQKHCKNEETEQSFIKEFNRNLNKILVVKKGQIAADRSLKFVVEFIKFSVKKENGNFLFKYLNIVKHNIYINPYCSNKLIYNYLIEC